MEEQKGTIEFKYDPKRDTDARSDCWFAAVSFGGWSANLGAPTVLSLLSDIIGMVQRTKVYQEIVAQYPHQR